MEKIKINDIELAYARRGKGTPLVLLHGFPLDHHLWDDVAPYWKIRSISSSQTCAGLVSLQQWMLPIPWTIMLQILQVCSINLAFKKPQ